MPCVPVPDTEVGVCAIKSKVLQYLPQKPTAGCSFFAMSSRPALVETSLEVQGLAEVSTVIMVGEVTRELVPIGTAEGAKARAAELNDSIAMWGCGNAWLISTDPTIIYYRHLKEENLRINCG